MLHVSLLKLHYLESHPQILCYAYIYILSSFSLQTFFSENFVLLVT